MADDDNFWWGVTSSSLRSEGVHPSADWSAWERDGKAPLSDEGSGFGSEFRDDLGQLAALGLTHINVGLEWSRLEPEPGKIDRDEFNRYRDVLAAARHVGLQPIVTLQSQTLPGWFHIDMGGFRDDNARNQVWTRHVDHCAEAFDGLVAGWIGVDDPIGWAIRGYLLGSRPPGRNDLEQALGAVGDAMEADRLAATILGSGQAPIISSFGLPPIFPVGVGAGPKARWWEHLFWDTWIGAIRDGELVVPELAPRQAHEYVDIYDIIGFSYSYPLGINLSGGFTPYPVEGDLDDTGLAPLPEELGVACRRLASELPGKKLLITGNGVTTNDDDWRDELLNQSLREIDSAVDDGVPLVGYFYDTGIDGYEGTRGFSTQRGLIGRDRNAKPSAERLNRHIVG